MTRPLNRPHEYPWSRNRQKSPATPMRRPSPSRFAAAFAVACALVMIGSYGCSTVTGIAFPASATPTSFRTLPVFGHDHTRTLDILRNGEAKYLADLSAEGPQPERYQAGTQKYTVSMTGNEIINLGFRWCAKSSAILQDNMQHISVSVTVDGYEVPSQDLQPIESERKPGTDPQYPEGLVCHAWVVLASEWPPGEHRVLETGAFDAEINDGFQTYGSGKYVYDYVVHVGGASP
jgi:hypothetical protein